MRSSYNKWGAEKTWSELCLRWFASKREATRAEKLRMLELAGEICDLTYQVPFILCKKPKITITIDFRYVIRVLGSELVLYEDAKGKMTPDFRVKLAWLKEKHCIDVRLVCARK